VSDAAIAVGVALLVAIAVAAVAWPFVSPARGVPEPVLSERDRRRIELLERRDAAYSGLRDLEQDHRTGKVSDEKLAELVQKHFDLRPKGIIQMLNLLRPIYLKTAAYGHFGRDEPEFGWESMDKVQALQADSGIKPAHA